MKPFKIGKKKKREVIKIEVIPKLKPPQRMPLCLFKNVHPPKFRKKYYFDN